MSSVCRECREHLDHCHGTVVHHGSRAPECTDDCGTPDGLHAFGIDCEAIGCVCSMDIAAGSSRLVS